MVLTTGLLEAPRPSALVGAMPVQPATVLVPAPAPAPAAPPGAAPPATDARDCGSSSSSSCGSYSDHEDNEDEPPARLTLQDDAVPATDVSASEWEASGEEGEAAEDSCDGEGEDRDDGGGVHSVEDLAGPPRGTTTGPVTASKTASRSSWVATVLGRILRPFKWKSTSGLHLQGRPGEQLGPRRASLCALPKVPPAASPAQHAQHAPPDRRIPLKKREQNVPLASRRKRRRRRSVPPAPPASQTQAARPSSRTAPTRTVRGSRGPGLRRKLAGGSTATEGSSDEEGAATAPTATTVPVAEHSDRSAEDVELEVAVDASFPEAEVGAEANPAAGPASTGSRFGMQKGLKLWRRLSTSLGKATSQPVTAATAADTRAAAPLRTRSATSLTAHPEALEGRTVKAPEDTDLDEGAPEGISLEITAPDDAVLEGRALERRSADSSVPGSLYHSRTTSQSRLSSLAVGAGAEADEGADPEDRPLSLCTANCRYDVVRRVSKRFGMKDVSEDEPWNLYWTDLSISLERCKDMKRFQKINHFPGMAEICRKDLLARNLNRMLRLFPKDYNFFPKTWCLPADLGDLNTYARTRRNRTYILKPDTGCQGKGIYLTRSVRDLKPHTRMICQVYIARPFLVDGFKFDMRVYTLVTSCDPLRVFVYNDGLVRFATSAYHEPNGHNTANVFMHLTNYAVNKHSRTFIVDEEAGSKRKISTLNKWLESKNYDVVDIWARIDELIVKTLIAALPVIRHNYHACFPAHDFTYACFELLGFDVLLDHKLKPYVLEVNHSPSFHTDAQIDREVKETLLMDTFGILNLGQYDKRKVMEEDRRRVRDRLLQSIAHRDTGSDSNVLTADSNPWKAQFDWEDSNMGNFRRVYPVPDGQPDKYEAFFHQNQSSLFQETAASRAREEASRQQRDLHEVKQKEEEARRSMTLARRREYERLRPESPGVGAAPGTLLRRSRNSRGKRGAAQPPAAGKKLHAKCVLNSFLPEAIVEAEESVRAAALQERGQLVQSKGIVQLIYQMMKENKSLCAEDLRKYAALNAEPHSGHSQGPAGVPGTNGGPRREDDAHRLPSLLTLIQKTTGQGHADINRGKGVVDPYEALVTGLPGPCPIPPGAGPTGPGPAGESAPLVAAAVPAVSLPLRPALCSRTPGFGMTCAEAPFWVRPGLRSSDLWSSNYMLLSSQAAQAAHQLYTQSQGQAVPRNTRSTLGRLVSTSFKLHNLEKRHPKPQVQQL